MPSIEPANIGLIVGGDISPLQASMQQGAAAVGTFSTQSQSYLSRLASSPALANFAKGFAVAGTAAVAGLTAITVAGASFIDNQSKIARTLGGTVDGVNALQYAADLAGIPMDALEASVRKLNAVLANPSAQVSETLTGLGLSAEKLLSMDVDKRVETIAAKFSELGYSTAQADAAFKELGLKAGEMQKLFQDGGAAIAAARTELEAWGFAISDTDAIAIEDANDSFTKAQRILSGIGQVIAVQVAPYVKDLVVRFTEAAKEAGGVGNLIKETFAPAGKVVMFMADAVAGVKRVFFALGAAALEVGALIATAALTMADNIVNGPTNAINGLISALNEIPGVDIKFQVPKLDGGAIEDAKKAAIELGRAFNERVQEELTAPLPSGIAKQWAADIEAERAKAGADFKGAEGATGSGDVSALGGDGKKEKAPSDAPDLGAELQKETDAQFDSLLNSDIAGNSEQLDRMKDLENAYAEHWREMNRIAVDQGGEIVGMVATQWGNNVGSTVAAGKSMINSFSGSSRKMFEISQAWAIGDALVSMYQGIAKGVALGYPAAIPAVAWAAATGIKAITGIKAQKFGGGGSGSGAAVGAAPSSSENKIPQNAQDSPEKRGQSIYIEGFDASHFYRGAQLQSLSKALEQNWKDGGGAGRVIFGSSK